VVLPHLVAGVPPRPERDDGEFRVVTVGRLVELKDHAAVLTALATLRKAVPGSCLLVVGEGSERGTLETLARSLAISDSVTFTGEVPHGRVLDILAGCDIFVLASHSEGMPNAVLEAMAAGLAVVATSVGGVPELSRDGETGILVPPGDRVALAEALATLAADPELRARLGAAARQAIASGPHSEQAVVAALMAFYKDALAGRLKPA